MLGEEDYELPSIRDQHRKRGFEVTTTSKQPQRSDPTSGLKFMAQTKYATMFVWTFELSLRKKEERMNLSI